MKQREIKFRAWHKTQKRMFEVYGLGIDFITEDTLDGVSPGDNCWHGEEIKDIEVMQFTGLKDKNGVEVYEKDLVNFTFFTYSEFEVEVKKQGVITCDNLGFVFKELNEGAYYLSDLAFDAEADLEVIGNIYQHET